MCLGSRQVDKRDAAVEPELWITVITVTVHSIPKVRNPKRFERAMDGAEMRKRFAIRLISVLSVCFLLYISARVYGSIATGYSWGDMDWNSDGETDLAEFLRSSDIGKRSILVDGKNCIEYFAYKDAAVIKLTCPS